MRLSRSANSGKLPTSSSAPLHELDKSDLAAWLLFPIVARVFNDYCRHPKNPALVSASPPGRAHSHAPPQPLHEPKRGHGWIRRRNLRLECVAQTYRKKQRLQVGDIAELLKDPDEDVLEDRAATQSA